ncbi:5-methyltetrahydropteroyltriglutamate--homocysteine S-methyltransferase [Cyclobacterium plantarum]|uniref:5-methyltetrahydropteroyltriglutamate--homocysteine methyltransferase n=1 Tax=Cyclobacterium plantarum TaxID=2716263 RepID=A0ABX0H9Y7_9BACT|nr:5-methyltetrahydropteroyltriglutamate--homocysteine S-methyltransferase [Cyclobacterium plantarum]NHE57154.1 5-methyltetrahydropteroyltriglutamate--homocysteine S-methyltransferase [Cyclobacterium plantarum]
MQTHNLGYPRIGAKRELKKACEKYWSGEITQEELVRTGWNIRIKNWRTQQEAGIDLIPSNDFSFYDQVLDMSLALGAIPERYHDVILDKKNTDLDLYFAMARGYQNDGLDLTAMEMTKWFDSNYHYIVPEFTKNQKFRLFSSKITNEFLVAEQDGIKTKPVIIGPLSYLLLGKEKEPGFDRLNLIDQLLPVYLEILAELDASGAEWVQFDEPFLTMDLTQKAREMYPWVYAKIRKAFPHLKILVATYFGGLEENLPLALSLPICALHLDMVRCPKQLEEALDQLPENLTLSLGLIDGRNIWKNDFQSSLEIIQKAVRKIGRNRIMIAPSSSLLHVPHDLEEEKNEQQLLPEIKAWMAFARQKIGEVSVLKQLVIHPEKPSNLQLLLDNQITIHNRQTSTLIQNQEVRKKTRAIGNTDASSRSEHPARKILQQATLNFPLFPTTTIGSFPQTQEVRNWRAKRKKGEIGEMEYQELVKQAIAAAIRKQEDIGLDLLVHGEFERNDMVEYFGEQLNGFAFTQNGWVQSYGSRCVKPPIIYGDISRPAPMTVFWSSYAQSLTRKWVKGMLTGPVTILQWSFVRNDQPRSETCKQIALAIREEVMDLERAGIKIIQIDEPAIREGLPLKKSNWKAYLDWAVQAFRISSSGVQDDTQIHTHMCYSEFNDIMESIVAMDADVITIECSRSQMKLLDAFADFNYPNEIGPGVYDIHAPRVPSKKEMVDLIEKAEKVIPSEQLWVNPDCGLKTRKWEETEAALKVMVEAAREIRLKLLKS